MTNPIVPSMRYEDEVAPLYSTAVAAGGVVIEELTAKDYGGSGFSVADPQGNLWSVGSYQPGRG